MAANDIKTEDFQMQTVEVERNSGTTFNFNMVIYPAIILHPSLGCPLIVDEKGPVSIFIVAGKTFLETFIDDTGGDIGTSATDSIAIATAISQHLKVVEWSEARKIKKDLSKQDKTIDIKQEDIVCTYLGKLERELKNAEGRHIANVRNSLLRKFRGAREKSEDRKERKRFTQYFINHGLWYVFQIDLHNMNLKSETLYDSYWELRNINPQKSDLYPNYLDIQDRIAREHFSENYYKYAGKEGPSLAFKVTEKGVELTPDPDTPIQIPHPIYVPPAGKTRLDIGHMSDVHVSSKQYAYKDKEATVIPGVDQEISPHIGNMANNNGDNFFELLNRMGGEADMVVITGDLYDHLHNYDSSLLKGYSTGKLWEAMYVDSMKSVHDRNEDFPCGIDALIVYSILMDFYTRHNKPVFITSGNHEAYQYPYGISPRIGKIRPNDGIPLDHNLTIYEAILLYGPAYSKLIPFPNRTDGKDSRRLNFNHRNFDWFYTLFTPLTDFVVNHGEMCLIGKDIRHKGFL